MTAVVKAGCKLITKTLFKFLKPPQINKDSFKLPIVESCKGPWNWMIFKVHSNLSHFKIL